MRTWIEVPAAANGRTATVLMDVDDFLRLEGRLATPAFQLALLAAHLAALSISWSTSC